VTDMTDPNWEPVMKRAAAVVTNRGGRTCHAAIIARELGIPAVVGCGHATEALRDGMLVTVSCCGGRHRLHLRRLCWKPRSPRCSAARCPRPAGQDHDECGQPTAGVRFLPVAQPGCGAWPAWTSSSTTTSVCTPKAILDYPTSTQTSKAVESVARGHARHVPFTWTESPKVWPRIAAAFWPKPVIVRLSDFKSNEYRKLIGGSRYEPEEENPMLGFRGAARYFSADFGEAFAMECEALKRVRDEMGLSNVQVDGALRAHLGTGSSA